jgi:hypothetical protein
MGMPNYAKLSIPSRSAIYFEYFDFSANSSSTTSNRFPLELAACTIDRSPSSRKESNHLIVVVVLAAIPSSVVARP